MPNFCFRISRHFIIIFSDSLPEIRNVVEKIKGDLMSERPYVIDEMISAKAIAAKVETHCCGLATRLVRFYCRLGS